MKYIITSCAFDSKTGEKITCGDSYERNEEIDSAENKVFDNTNEDSLLDIKKTYESFWNDLIVSPEMIVSVISIKRL